jgi:hypothetical protein
MMPLNKYFHGHGEQVMQDMKKKYGDRGEEVFYRTANKKGMKPEDKKSAGRKRALSRM